MNKKEIETLADSLALAGFEIVEMRPGVIRILTNGQVTESLDGSIDLKIKTLPSG